MSLLDTLGKIISSDAGTSPVTRLDLDDIQGNVVRGYAKFGFKRARYLFYRIADEYSARAALADLLPLITNAAPWTVPPDATTNIAFTHAGLRAIGVPVASLNSFPGDFSMGMQARRDILDDNGASAPEHWDPVWRDPSPVHVLVTINAIDERALATRFDAVEQVLGGRLQLARGHRDELGDTASYQSAAVLTHAGEPTPREHFGYVDGISNPYFEGAGLDPANVIGGGKPTGADPSTIAGWAPVEAGEFILGHRDESGEYPAAPTPRMLARNGCYLVYRKLHENTASFDNYLNTVGEDFPAGPEALAAKFAGRWRNGAPVTLFPTAAAANNFIKSLTDARAHAADGGSSEEYLRLRSQMVGFSFDDDPDGARCPFGAHIRRTNPRGSLRFGHDDAFATPGALVNRRRLLRRGLPYGESTIDRSDAGDHGIIFMAVCSSISRQFEFVQQQWVNYGNDFRLGNDKDPILGDHEDDAGQAAGQMIIENDPAGEAPPFFCANMPRFVEVRGGDYFFLPGLTALGMLADGTVDPT